MLVAAPARAAEPLHVLAAFTLKPVLDAIAQDYGAKGGEVTLVYRPSPGLAQQIENGAPGDLFFSADPMWTEQLMKHGLIKPGTVTNLVGNQLVLIAGKGRAPPVLNTRELPRLIGAGPVAMCDPDSHPTGRMAKASLTSLGLWDDIAPKVARAENPLLAVTMVARGDAPYAIVFTTDAMTDPGVDIVMTFPDDSHPPIRYPVAILAKSTNPDATVFLDRLKFPAATALFKRFGYVTLGAQDERSSADQRVDER
ncbi:MAG TPA: molybdate ABC transporter substrate-binding protein [Stellaceae bacterium]|nr:molybdate ABC transporter substrate-binding protein [Stellaceae bacterium]